MAGKTRHLVDRNGRYFARLVVPTELRSAVGKTELRTPLGGDYRTAMRLLPGAVAQLQHEIAVAEREAAKSDPTITTGRYPLSPIEMAGQHYAQRLAFDDQLRNDQSYSFGYVDDRIAQRLRDAMAGKLSDADLTALIGPQIERFRSIGNLTAQPGSDEWRQIARALCAAEYEALSRVAERDEGDFAGVPSHPLIAQAVQEAARAQVEPRPLSIVQLMKDYVKSRQTAGYLKEGGKRHILIAENLRKFLKHNDARKITKANMAQWRDHLLKTLSPKTTKDIYLSTMRSMFKWAVDNDHLPENVAASVQVPKLKQVRGRERGYTDEEALVVLKAARAYEPKPDDLGRMQEADRTIIAKRWVPLLCAFTGARVSEITQLRREDIRQEGDVWVARITPDAGTVKTGAYRDVPLHRQIIAEGFIDYLKTVPSGPLFHAATEPERYAAAAQRLSNRLASWLRDSGLTPAGLQPSHAWRHRLKTQALELELNMRVIDAIQGHAPKTAGDNYGDVTLKARYRAIDALPDYDL